MDDRAVLRIGEVARRTGVAVPTLRAWETRYGLLEPARTDGGHRLYSEVDVARVRGMQRLLDDGWSASAAAREVLRGPAPAVQQRPAGASGDAAEQLARRLEAALGAFDAAEADTVLDDVLARLEVPHALDQVIMPVLRHLGDGWEDDPRVITREHFASNTLRPRLARLLRPGSSRAAARTCLAAAPEHEEHDLGLLAGAVVAADAGWRVHYLGARTPTAAIERGVSQLDPDVVLVAALSRANAEAFLAEHVPFRRAATVLGGAGFLAGDDARLAGALVHDGPISGLADTLQRAVTARVGRVGRAARVGR